MKKPLIWMVIILLIIAILCVLGVGAYLFLLHPRTPAAKPALTPQQEAQLQVSFPQMTTNLGSSGLIQFTMTLQADSSSTKNEINVMMPEIENSVNGLMRQFTASELQQVSGFNQLRTAIQKTVNAELPHGDVTKVYLSQIVVQ
ncbi:flagellar basal body-associated FliL family protein [Alicyclobacillus tolerans]|uniref:Flagellar protein FliL n=2 Tax=Alicyclobacillus tolerans TaxID=90970 RepID=A0A1M6RPV6_9BACL|nr:MULTISPECIES: flagellar basal body-associated FliL family protein [Alicyclobacillus]MDP9728853.1 flagellar FliL protein [Alicyclobacillus tengchongensis]QRF23713.1 flagellar basal body-associated FliL family protein [Alicyclobacillus sp. TC]SHK34357.1 flagellar FliL protein [Alicyclobacillus montanus]